MAARTWLNRLFQHQRQLQRRKRRNPSHRRETRSLQTETLEARRVLAGVIAIADAVPTVEGDSGTITPHDFQITLSEVNTSEVTVGIATANGTAKFDDGDFVSSLIP